MPFWTGNTDLSLNQMRDRKLISENSKDVISGYLNLRSEDGWKEGSDPRIGAAFTRFILVNYFNQGKKLLGSNEPILEKAIETFRDIGSFGHHSLLMSYEEGHRPRTNRVCYDQAIQGWQKHAISRMVGNLASTYDPSKPFFEILVNSARPSNDEPLCQPFFISIHENEKDLDKRRLSLALQVNAPSNLAHFQFYATQLKNPETYLKENQDRLGPNSTRLLKGLDFLQKKTISAQKTGNCWIKQPMRCLLASLYLEFFSQCKEWSPEKAWEEATDVYKRIQRTVAIPHVEALISQTGMTSQMKEAALRGIETQKNL